MAAALLLLVAGCGCSAQTREARDIVRELNAVRSDPRRYASHLESRVGRFRGNVLHLPGQVPLKTSEGVTAVREAIRVLRSSEPAPKVFRAAGLERAARDHVRDIGPKGLLQHQGSDESQPADRTRRYFQGDTAVAEVISFGPSQARDVIVDLLIDDGVPDRGHRRILLDPRFRFAGAACGPHATYRVVCVIDLVNR